MPITDPKIAGALFDFMGYLTTRPKSIHLGSKNSVYRGMDALQTWAKERGLNLEEADVKGWNKVD